MPLLSALAGLVCVWLLIRFVAALVDYLWADPVAVAPASIDDAVWSQALPESLARWHLFGSTLPSIDARSAVDAPDTTLDLQLVGTLADRDPTAGIAIIAAADGQQAAYRAGAALPGGARLRGVHGDYVVLVHDGRDEILRLPREFAGSADAGPVSQRASVHGASDAQDRRSPAIAPVAVAGLEGVDWSAVQQQMQVDPAELARQIRILPVIEGGQVIGVRLSGGANTPLLARLGLRADDVVTSVNGVSVLDTGRAHQVISDIANAERASVTVRRNGREETLNVSLR